MVLEDHMVLVCDALRTGSYISSSRLAIPRLHLRVIASTARRAEGAVWLAPRTAPSAIHSRRRRTDDRWRWRADIRVADLRRSAGGARILSWLGHRASHSHAPDAAGDDNDDAGHDDEDDGANNHWSRLRWEAR